MLCDQCREPAAKKLDFSDFGTQISIEARSALVNLELAVTKLADLHPAPYPALADIHKFLDNIENNAMDFSTHIAKQGPMNDPTLSPLEWQKLHPQASIPEQTYQNIQQTLASPGFVRYAPEYLNARGEGPESVGKVSQEHDRALSRLQFRMEAVAKGAVA